MSFDNSKKQAINKKDKSGIGKFDTKIRNLVKLINSKKDYYTTSSCSGRIGLITDAPKGKSKWLFKSHKPVTAKQILEVLQDPNNNKLWFRQEPLILHVACRNIQAAKKLLTITQKAGFKRAGIISLSKKIIVEVKSDEIIYTMVYNTHLTPPAYITVLVREANTKLKLNFARIKQLEKEIKK